MRERAHRCGLCLNMTEDTLLRYSADLKDWICLRCESEYRPRREPEPEDAGGCER